jgi:hypothetical protein
MEPHGFVLRLQIHKTAQGALLALLEQGFLPPDVVEAKLVPLVVNWTLVEDVELNTASVGVSPLTLNHNVESYVNDLFSPCISVCKINI